MAELYKVMYELYSDMLYSFNAMGFKPNIFDYFKDWLAKPISEIWKTEEGADGKNPMQLTVMCLYIFYCKPKFSNDSNIFSYKVQITEEKSP